jgi:hypothetical protein
MSSALAITMILFLATECTTAKAEIEDSAIFFSKEGSTSYTLRYSNIMIEYNLYEQNQRRLAKVPQGYGQRPHAPPHVPHGEVNQLYR